MKGVVPMKLYRENHQRASLRAEIQNWTRDRSTSEGASKNEQANRLRISMSVHDWKMLQK